MKLLIDTSSKECHLTIVDSDNIWSENWLADRNLAQGLFVFIEKSLSKYNFKISDIDGIGVYRGPGSFTGLRIGMTVANTIADSLKIAIVGTMGDDWSKHALERLNSMDNDKIVTPFYGEEPKITQPKK